MRSNIAQQLADYRGVLGWNAGVTYPALEIPLYIKELPIPTRRPKVTQVATIEQYDAASGRDIGVNFMFFAAPEILQVHISGFLITPISRDGGNFRWVIKSLDGDIINSFGNLRYGELVSAFLAGRVDNDRRRDPDYFVTPYGQRYNKPIISSWEPTATTNVRKESFQATLYLEK